MTLQDAFIRLIVSLSGMEGVLSIGKSGGESLPEQNESDIDVFIFCDAVPTAHDRSAAIGDLGGTVSEMKLSERKGRFWGVCDFLTLVKAEVCLMYFTVADMDAEIESVLSGSRLDRESEYFYPSGRCASVLSMHVLSDKNGYIARLKARLSTYPPALADKAFRHHMRKTYDAEDFERAVSRDDVLFYHSVLELAIDHFLQALFALNHCFFPSRKRSAQLMESFDRKPKNCAARMLEVIALGSKPETLRQSSVVWAALLRELSEYDTV